MGMYLGSVIVTFPCDPPLRAPPSLSSVTFPCDLPLRAPSSLSSGDILNNEKNMEYSTQSGTLTCAFNFMQLRRIKRNSDKKGSEVGHVIGW